MSEREACTWCCLIVDVVRCQRTTHCAGGVQVVLRKLFERLGSTYIKLGQFIASSPTLCALMLSASLLCSLSVACRHNSVRLRRLWQTHPCIVLCKDNTLSYSGCQMSST